MTWQVSPVSRMHSVCLCCLKVINETVDSTNYTSSLLALRNGVGIVEKFLSRTFTLPTGSIYVSPGGQRHVDMLVQQVNWQTGDLE
ncbi:hypothetical protein RvY_10981, partial [Ramazzottius varieornatus]